MLHAPCETRPCCPWDRTPKYLGSPGSHASEHSPDLQHCAVHCTTVTEQSNGRSHSLPSLSVVLCTSMSAYSLRASPRYYSPLPIRIQSTCSLPLRSDQSSCSIRNKVNTTAHWQMHSTKACERMLRTLHSALEQCLGFALVGVLWLRSPASPQAALYEQA